MTRVLTIGISSVAPSTGRSVRLREHYSRNWQSQPQALKWMAGPIADFPHDFHVLQFPPGKHNFWIYSTCGMSQAQDLSQVELHLFSPRETPKHVELLTAVAHYHRTGSTLNAGHTVNFGRPWLPESRCDHGLLSLPYLDGPALELAELDGGVVRCLWLVPVTASEVAYAKERGAESLEAMLESAGFNYLDAGRQPVV
jgi:suppressor of fused protein SUFU